MPVSYLDHSCLCWSFANSHLQVLIRETCGLRFWCSAYGNVHNCSLQKGTNGLKILYDIRSDYMTNTWYLTINKFIHCKLGWQLLKTYSRVPWQNLHWSKVFCCIFFPSPSVSVFVFCSVHVYWYSCSHLCLNYLSFRLFPDKVTLSLQSFANPKLTLIHMDAHTFNKHRASRYYEQLMTEKY